MTRTDCWTDLPHHEPAGRPCAPEPLLKGGLDCLPGAGTLCAPNPIDAERFKIDIRAIDEKLHRYGLLPHLHIGCDERNNPTVTIDTAGSKTDCFGYMHVPDLVGGLSGALPVGRADGGHGHYEAPPQILRDASEVVDQAARTMDRLIRSSDCHIDPKI
jgi:hypothetical protein